MLLVVGQILRAHGIRGELLVDVRTDDPDERFAVGSVLVTDSTARRVPALDGNAGNGRDREPPADAPLDAPAGAPLDAWRVPPTLTVETVRPHLGRLIVVFDGVYDRNIAEELRGVLLCVDSADLPPSEDPDEYHDHQLVGLAAVDERGTTLGEVVAVDHAPASDLLVVRLADGRRALVPFVSAIVPEVDLAGGRVVLTPPEGLFDL